MPRWAAADPQTSFTLTAKPEPVLNSRFATLNEAELVGRALANRPETRAASLTSMAADIGRKIAEAPLYPTVSVTGSYFFADPNPRVPFQSDPWTFTGTWSLGLMLSYDLGGLPANLAARDAQARSVEKSAADERRQKETVVLDVRGSLLTFQQTRKDYALVSGMIEQARENERVTEEKVRAGHGVGPGPAHGPNLPPEGGVRRHQQADRRADRGRRHRARRRAPRDRLGGAAHAEAHENAAAVRNPHRRGHCIVFLQSMGDLYLPNLMSDIVNRGITNRDIDYITRTGLQMLAVALGSSLCAVVASYLSAHISMGMGEAIRSRIFRTVSSFSLKEFDKIGTPSLITRSTNDVTQIQNVLVMSIRMMIGAPITAIGGIILALQKDRGLAWIIGVVLPILAAVIIAVAVKGFPLFQAIQKKIDQINLVLRENLTGIQGHPGLQPGGLGKATVQ